MNEIFKVAYQKFSELIGSGMYIMPPDNNFLFTQQYDFSQLSKHREGEPNLIGQWQSDEEQVSGYPCANGLKFKVDFGDSAQKTGILAFCNSQQDQDYLPLFEQSSGIMVRHPTQPPWNNWRNCTRDQLLAYSGGCWRAKKHDIVKRLLDEHNKRTNIIGLPLCQNSERDCPGTTKPEGHTDILLPMDVMYLRICSGDFNAYLDPLAQFALQLAIEATDKDVTLEKNQLILQAIVCGRLDLYTKVHDNYKENIRHYWGGWRNQAQIGEAFIKVIEQELKRYSGQVAPSTLGLPIETIKSLFNLNLKELFSGDSFAELDEYVKGVLTALSNDIQRSAKEIETYVSNSLKNPINLLNIPFLPMNPISRIITNLYNGTDLSEVYFRLNEIQKGIENLTKQVKELKEDVHAIPEKVAAYDTTLSLNGTIKEFEIYYDSYCRILEKKGSEEALIRHKADFERLSDNLLQNTIRFLEVERSYPYLPFLASCMDMHLSCLALSGTDPSLIVSILNRIYKPWFEKISSGSQSDSVETILSNLKVQQKNNKFSFLPLYTLTFEVFEGFKLGNFKGKVRKTDYLLTQYLDSSKIAELQPLIELGYLNEEDFPEKGIETFIGEGILEGDGTTYKMSVKLESYETFLQLRPIDIWYWCAKLPNTQSPPLPQQNVSAFNWLKDEIVVVGESIIRHAKYKHICQTTLKKIDEIITDTEKLIT